MQLAKPDPGVCADVQERLLAAGIEPSSMKPEQFGEHIRAEVAKWAKVVKAAGIEPQTW